MNKDDYIAECMKDIGKDIINKAKFIQQHVRPLIELAVRRGMDAGIEFKKQTHNKPTVEEIARVIHSTDYIKFGKQGYNTTIVEANEQKLAEAIHKL